MKRPRNIVKRGSTCVFPSSSGEELLSACSCAASLRHSTCQSAASDTIRLRRLSPCDAKQQCTLGDTGTRLRTLQLFCSISSIGQRTIIRRLVVFSGWTPQRQPTPNLVKRSLKQNLPKPAPGPPMRASWTGKRRFIHPIQSHKENKELNTGRTGCDRLGDNG